MKMSSFFHIFFSFFSFSLGAAGYGREGANGADEAGGLRARAGAAGGGTWEVGTYSIA